MKDLINKNCQDCVYRENIERPVLDLEQQNIKLQSQIDEVKEFIIKVSDDAKYDLYNEVNNLNNLITKARLQEIVVTCHKILSKLEEIGK